MEIITLSDKYQVVLPKSGDITIKTGSALDELYGSMPGAWGKSSDKYLGELRDEADSGRSSITRGLTKGDQAGKT